MCPNSLWLPIMHQLRKDKNKFMISMRKIWKIWLILNFKKKIFWNSVKNFRKKKILTMIILLINRITKKMQQEQTIILIMISLLII